MTKILFTSITLALVSSIALAYSPIGHAADLVVSVENIQTANGEIFVGLFTPEDQFPQHVSQGQRVVASQRDADGKLRITFAGLAEGTYAVSAFHDLDQDGKLNTNVMGIPTEPYGFSGEGKGSFGPPSFKDAAFTLPSTGTSIAVRIQ